jgi:FixJ family two-component response regulator
MRETHREIIRDETGRRLESMLRRFAGQTQLYPRLAPGVTHAQVRRTINRLRSGATHSLEPDIPSHILADVLEGSIAQDTLMREVVAEMDDLNELERRLTRRSR